MQEEIDLGRQKTPLGFKAVIFFMFGGCFLLMANMDQKPPPAIYLLLVSLGGVLLGLAFYGVVSLIRDWKRTKTINGLLEEIHKTYQDAKK